MVRAAAYRCFVTSRTLWNGKAAADVPDMRREALRRSNGDNLVDGAALHWLHEQTTVAAGQEPEPTGARLRRWRIAGVSVVCVLAVVAVVVTHLRSAGRASGSASSSQPGVTSTSTSPSTAGSSTLAATTVTPLRACAGLVGKPFYTALIGMQVTCSFGGRDTGSRRVSVTAESCPDTSPFYILRSTAPDAVDRNVYYGSQGGDLFAAKAGAITLAQQRRRACTE